MRRRSTGVATEKNRTCDIENINEAEPEMTWTAAEITQLGYNRDGDTLGGSMQGLN